MDLKYPGRVVERAYFQPGYYSEILKITDRDGRIDYDFAVVDVVDRDQPEQLAPSIHAAYAPTMGIQPRQSVRFLVRTFGMTDGEEKLGILATVPRKSACEATEKLSSLPRMATH